MRDPVEYRKMEKVQRDSWGVPSDESIIPFHTLIAAQYHSGLVLGAYDAKRLIGGAFGISAYDQNRKRPYHYSHITCVHPDYQGIGVGYRLKKKQRTELLRRNIDLVKWTYDPLQAGNASLNIRKLGAIVREYHRNMYGRMPDGLNRGMVSDRFVAEWWIKSPHVRKRVEGRTGKRLETLSDRNGRLVNETRASDGFRKPVHLDLGMKDQHLLFEIPLSILEVKRKDMREAVKWTLQARKAFEHYFGKGYTVIDVLAGEENRVYYLLDRNFRVSGERSG